MGPSISLKDVLTLGLVAVCYGLELRPLVVFLRIRDRSIFSRPLFGQAERFLGCSALFADYSRPKDTYKTTSQLYVRFCCTLEEKNIREFRVEYRRISFSFKERLSLK